MGKLHTLRRAILRDPKKWKDRGARLWGTEWYSSYWSQSYKAFIRKVLHEVGIADKGSG